ncbi:ABC1-domain-containing protein [Pleurotus eryngii]|uniref:ABC1-domain-containing protein n=1 Tax=Pleurotus eryngii TaxID=5323 RepID=A0A9P6A921_PLEER|nr:ABC1-domain-containing protein [Pleurotus eryngii]
MHYCLHLGLFGRRTLQLNAKGRRGSPLSFSQPSYRLISTRRVSGTNSRNSRSPWPATSTGILVIAGGSYAAYENYQPFRHSILAAVRCWRVAVAAVLGAIDYKATFAKAYESEDVCLQAYSECHTRSARRVLKALLANGGIFIKLGQHMSSLFVLPSEWTSTMKPLQDQCEPTPYEHVEALFVSDMGLPISELFEEFDPEPIGVASLAQVHVARLRDSGKQVAVKLQHPHLAEFCDIDMEMVEVTLGWIKHWFPDFEFTWLAEEMRTNLPKEMDFTHEANNAARTSREFQDITTSLYIPSVLTSTKRVLIMEYIKGGRVDDLVYLADSNIDRNKVALELSRIFNQMVFINGWFHADPHPGNLLIRPAPMGSKSPYNFEIALLDHGLYFDLDTELRVNYSKFWLSLIAPASPSTSVDRRKYAELVGNIGPDLYPVFEAAITGRAALEGTWEDDVGSPSESENPSSTFKRASGMIDMMPQTEEEMEAIRNAVINREGLLVSVFDVLRRVPRRVLMVLKLNDLTRHLDHALMTTHSNIRIFLITAKYCTFAVWQNDRRRLIDLMRDQGLISLSLLSEYFTSWWRFKKNYYGIVFMETIMDARARLALLRAWTQGLWSRGFEGAHKAAAGLA